MARFYTLFFVGLLAVVQLHAQTQVPALIWAKMARSGTSELIAHDVAIDPAGFVYTVGGFDGTVDFNPGAGVFNLTSTGATPDIFVQKLDTNGNFIWARAMGGVDAQEGYQISLDNSGNVLVSGYFIGTADFDPGAGTSNMTAVGNWDLFVMKLNSAGAFQWARRSGAVVEAVLPYTNLVDASGNVYVAGWYTGAVDFNPGAGTNYLTSAGFMDAFIQKLDASGNFVWARSIGGTEAEQVQSIAMNAAGELVVLGIFCSPTVDLDPGAGSFNMSISGPGGQDLYFQKLSAAGNFISACKIGGAGAIIDGVVTVDPSGNVIATGLFQGTVDFDPGAGVSNLVSTIDYNSYVMKLNSAFAFQWVKHLGGTGYVATWGGLATDNMGSIYATGSFSGTADLDPGLGVRSFTAVGYDLFVLKLDPAGGLAWVGAAQGSDETSDWSLALDVNRNVYVCGAFYGNTDFDPQATTFFLNSLGTSYAAHVFKLRQVNAPLALNPLVFTAEAGVESVDLKWLPDPQVQWSAFEVQRSLDGSDFMPIGLVSAVHFPVQGYVHEFVDRDVSQGVRYWYRLKLVDSNGEFSWSEIVDAVLGEDEGAVVVYPNPASTGFTVSSGAGLGEIRLMNLLGQVVWFVDAGLATTVTVDLGGVPAGVYLVRVGNGRRFTKVIVE